MLFEGRTIIPELVFYISDFNLVEDWYDKLSGVFLALKDENQFIEVPCTISIILGENNYDTHRDSENNYLEVFLRPSTHGYVKLLMW